MAKIVSDTVVITFSRITKDDDLSEFSENAKETLFL